MAADKAELRGLAPADLVAALDAIAVSRNMDRTTLVNKLLTISVQKIAHQSNVLQRMARGNALLSEPYGFASDAYVPASDSLAD